MILFIDACAREGSRTRYLAKELLGKLKGETRTVRLYEEGLSPMSRDTLAVRDSFVAAGDYSGEMFRFAREFRDADEIVIAAPFWDLSFPAILKTYFENISVSGLTFRYTGEGIPVGLCRAKRLYYVTTAGGKIFDGSFGFGYVRALCTGMFGIKECVPVKAEELDVWGNDPAEIISDAVKGLDTIIG